MNTNRAEYLPHSGVMVEELTSVVQRLPKGIFIDATYGFGSHFKILKQYKDLDLIGFDRDSQAISASHKDDEVYKLNFSQIPSFLTEVNKTPISGIFYDFGLSSHQIDSVERGFSFQKNADLDMRMDQENNKSAKKIVNEYAFEDLLEVFNKFSEDKNSYSVAKKIVDQRPIQTTLELVDIIKSALPKQNPIFTTKTVRRIFQGIRIEVNEELSEIKLALEGIKNHIQPHGVILCISYHSLEDKIVKSFMQELTTSCICDPKAPICNCNTEQEFIFLPKKKYTPTGEEIESNPRAKSAIMRGVTKL